MANKPSQWTPQEAWARGVQETISALGPMPSMVHAREWLQRCAFPFPADPPERVSDAVLQAIVDDADHGSNRWLLAMELIERRAKDKPKEPTK